MPRAINIVMRFCGKVAVILFPLVLFYIARALPATAQGTNGGPVPSETVISNMNGFWALPPEEQSQMHRIRMELLI